MPNPHPGGLGCLLLVWILLFDLTGMGGAGAGFFRVLRFPLPIVIPPISPQSPSPIIWGWYNRPVVAAVPKVPPHKLKKNCHWLPTAAARVQTRV
jgi:hypothetical protein